VKTCILDNLAV